ncbi:MAG TPA: hypothetical protein ENN89_02455 [Synergistetes bacterium]|nr:hypothetical protein [Synergistota bacterium]
MNCFPEGYRNIGGEKSEGLEKGKQKVLELLDSYGYVLFQPSPVQLFGPTWERLSPEVRSRMVMAGSSSGEACCLIPDLTIASVGHVAATRAPEERPLRVCYSERVFRAPVPPDRDIDSFQVGAELIGWDGNGADLEILTLVLRAMELLEAKGSFVVLGDACLLRSFLETLPMETAAALRYSLISHSFTRYRDTLDRSPVPGSLRPILEALPSLRGGMDTLDRAREMLPEGIDLESIRDLAKGLSEAGFEEMVQIDLGLARELDYYSGPVFEVFCEGQGRPVGGGGRYDGLLSSFGMIGQATGFSLEIDRITGIIQKPRTDTGRVMTWAGNLPARDAMAMADLFTERSIPVELSWVGNSERSRDLARRRGYSWWADLPNDKVFGLFSPDVIPGPKFREGFFKQ